ncbi:MAG: hypothetical protein JWM95_324 [Gemmatimonadetes bacterium]|nr:hypothetical protein [Gemmatimonadota bacterium]
MSKDAVRLPGLSAALAGIPAGLQTIGPWSGRRQLFVKFAGEAETATIYSAAALQGELKRLTARSKYHSVAIIGRDALVEAEFLIAVFQQNCPDSQNNQNSQNRPLPVMLDHDGQRPSALEALLPTLSLVQVTLDGREGAASIERTCATIDLAAQAPVDHAVAIMAVSNTSDAPLLRIVEQVHKASAGTQIVVHPPAELAMEHDRRWVLWLEQAMAVHGDVRVLPRWPVAAAWGQDSGTRNARSG